MAHKFLTPEFQSHFHAAMTVFWVLLIVPSLIWWKDSILFVIIISLWANVASHWASYQAARAEIRASNTG